MGLDDRIKLITMIPKLKEGENITRYAIGPAKTTAWCSPGGAAVLLPIEEPV